MKTGLRKTLGALVLFALPTALARPIANALGHRIGHGCTVGFSLLYCDLIALEAGVSIGHLNLVRIRRLIVRRNGRIGRTNIINGPLSLRLGPKSELGNGNRVLRAAKGVTSGPAALTLDVLSKITSRHLVDCTRSVRIGSYAIVAGANSQLWTHGYVHDADGPGRYRIDGRIVIEDNVYIGSASFISMGVRIGRGSVVGGGTAVARSLPPMGVYVSAAVRTLARPPDPEARSDLQPARDDSLVERVFVRRHP